MTERAEAKETRETSIGRAFGPTPAPRETSGRNFKL